MPLPKRKPDIDEDNVVYVLPPWSQPRRVGWRANIYLRSAVETAQAVAVAGFGFMCLAGLAYVVYRAKCSAGIDLFPSMHASDIIPWMK
jgi:hypothetical protein